MSGIHLGRLLVVLLAGSTLAVSTPSPAGAKPAATPAKPGCSVLVTQREHRAYARKVYARATISKDARKRLRTMRACQHSKAAHRNTQALEKRLGRVHRLRSGPLTPLAQCIVQAESGGDPQANNGSHFGIGQWDIQTWLGHGGGRFAPTPLGATKGEQMQVLNEALANGHSDAWTPYDPC